MRLLAVILTGWLGFAGTTWAQTFDADDEDEGDPGYGDPETPVQPAPPPVNEEPPAAPKWQYRGPHAIHAEYGSGWCNMQGLHAHPYPPFDDHLFQEDHGAYYFVGDPVDFGYSGSTYWYNAAHPIAAGFGVGWCFIGSPHRHLYRPFGAYFAACGPYSCYTGPFDAWYWHWRAYWSPYWASYYPRFYRSGLYYRTHRPASPGRWAHVGWRGPRGWARPVANVGHRWYGTARGVATRTFNRPGGTPRTGPATHSTTSAHYGSRAPGPPHYSPRAADAGRPTRSLTSPSGPRSFNHPGHGVAASHTAPRATSTPRFSAPRSNSGFHGGGRHR
jgi:hypothetical protein